MLQNCSGAQYNGVNPVEIVLCVYPFSNLVDISKSHILAIVKLSLTNIFFNLISK